jgi:3-hydroxy-9,10-secoandrosta-1,3,5(10)-triene-9,17-dione monooxygenase reductase component
VKALSLDEDLRERELRSVVRECASSVAVITVAWDGILHGMTVTSFATVSFRPPAILVCLHQVCRTHRLVQASSHFVVNFLTENQCEWSDRFAGRQPQIEDRFAGIHTVTGVTGTPIFADCLAWLECRVTASHTAGDHTIFVADVVAANTGIPGQPLIYHRGGYRLINA